MPNGPLGALFCLCMVLALSAVPQGGCLAQEGSGKRPVGLIVSIVPHQGKLPASNVLVKSQGAERPVSEGDFVSEGDEIIVPGRDQTVVISQRGSNSTICNAGDAADRCRSVVAGGSLLSPIGRFYESIIRISRRMTSTTSAASTLSSRDALDVSPLSMTIDRSRPQKLQPGERTLWLCWSGGDGPFQVNATMGGKSLADTTSTAREAILPPIRIADQTVVVTIRDVRGQKITVPIQGSKAMPAPPAFSKAAPSEEADQFIQAAWLSQQDGGSLKLEAAQRLTALTPKIRAADTLRRGLLIVDE